ncbi:hypothetical protein V1478_004535 [Vespula squamosa]|uniref:Uncharacterized protein n=1 Tax=Vespula squamosa TaxID=30214 RepID=A0ABD2BGG3_VESSQ
MKIIWINKSNGLTKNPVTISYSLNSASSETLECPLGSKEVTASPREDESYGSRSPLTLSILNIKITYSQIRFEFWYSLRAAIKYSCVLEIYLSLPVAFEVSVLRARDDSRKSSGLLSIPPSPEVKRCFAIAKGVGEEKTKESFGRIGVEPYDKIVSLKNDRDLRESSVGIAKYSDIPYNVSERDCFGSSGGVALRRRTRIEKEDRKDERGVGGLWKGARAGTRVGAGVRREGGRGL